MSKLQGIIERACREWFPDQKIWTNYRPDWLHGMEIDIFLPDIRIAIEVQGHQHYLFVPDLQQTVEQFKAQVKRDKRKKHLIRQRGLAFFTVPCVNMVMGGLQQKLGKHLRRKLITPDALRQEWSEHRLQLNTRKDYTRYKLKGNKLIPVNKASAKLLRATQRAGNDFSTASIDSKASAPRHTVCGHSGLPPVERRLASAYPRPLGSDHWPQGQTPPQRPVPAIRSWSRGVSGSREN